MRFLRGDRAVSVSVLNDHYELVIDWTRWYPMLHFCNWGAPPWRRRIIWERPSLRIRICAWCELCFWLDEPRWFRFRMSDFADRFDHRRPAQFACMNGWHEWKMWLSIVRRFWRASFDGSLAILATPWFWLEMACDADDYVRARVWRGIRLCYGRNPKPEEGAYRFIKEKSVVFMEYPWWKLDQTGGLP